MSKFLLSSKREHHTLMTLSVMGLFSSFETRFIIYKKSILHASFFLTSLLYWISKMALDPAKSSITVSACFKRSSLDTVLCLEKNKKKKTDSDFCTKP